MEGIQPDVFYQLTCGLEVKENMGFSLYGCGSKKKTLGDHRFWSIFPFTNRFFGVPGIFDPMPLDH